MWYELGWNHPLILTFDPNFQQDIQVAILRSLDPSKKDHHIFGFLIMLWEKIPSPSPKTASLKE